MNQKLTLNDVRPKLPFRINYGMGDIQVRNFIPSERNQHYIIDWDVYLPSKAMNLQRGFIWTQEQKNELIYSVFKGIKIPPISVISFDHKIYQIIDGKQRFSTIISFCGNEFPIFWKGQFYFFSDLHWDIAGEFLYHCITANIGYEYPEQRISDEAKIAWFEMINFAGTPQDLEHLKKLKNGG